MSPKFAVFLVAAALAAQTTHSVTLAWTDTLNPAGTAYNVYRAPGLCTGTPAFVKIATAAAKSYVDATATPANFCYEVTAVYGGLESAPSNTVLASVPSFAPTGTAVAVKQVGSAWNGVVTWTDTLNPPTGTTTWNVYRATGLCSGTPVFSKLASALTVLTFTDATITAGNYCYAVTATVNGVESPQSNLAGAPIPAFAPTQLTGTAQ